MGLKFNPPPGWPLPWDFEPPPGWEPDPAWPAPPPNWPLWIGSGAPQILYQAPAGEAYVPGYMRESLEPEPSPGRQRPARWRSALRRRARRRNRVSGKVRGGGHRRRRKMAAAGEEVALSVVGLVAIGFIAFEVLGPGIKPTSSAAQAGAGHHSHVVNLLALRTGACFEDPAKARPIGSAAADVTALPCTLAHNAQIFARFPARGRTYPGRTALQRQGSHHCLSAFAGRLDGARLSPGISVIDVVPSRARWSAGLRTISCVVVDPAAHWTKSLLKAHGGRKLSGYVHPRGALRGSARGHTSASGRRKARPLGTSRVATPHGQPPRLSRRAHPLSM